MAKRKHKTVGALTVVFRCRVRQLRDAAGLTLRDLEERTGISNAAISFIERGTNPTLRHAIALAKALGRSVEEIWSQLQ